MSIQNNQGPSSLSKIFFLVFFVAAFLSGAKAQTTQGVLDADYNALVDLYNSADGESWAVLWSLETPVSGWEGISVTGDRVTAISLPSSFLAGPLPASLGNLTALESIDLSDNILTGPIPAGLFTIATLTSINLSLNSLEGTIPDPSAMTNLTALNLSSNGLSGSIPASLFTLPALYEVSLFENELTGEIPDVVFSSSLIFIDLAFNFLTGAVPSSITDIPGLNYLYLDNNELTDLPTGFDQQELYEFTVYNNFFDFGDIENAEVAGIFYDPQNSLPKIPNFSLMEGEELTLSYSIGGTSNNYQWFKGGEEIQGATTNTYTVANATLADEDTYYLRITSNIVTDLILVTESTFVTIIEADNFGGVTQEDYEALEALYNATAGAGWVNSDGWLEGGPVSDWHGVFTSGNRVTGISLPFNNLAGTLPSQMANLTALESLYLNDNTIGGTLDYLMGLSNLQLLNMANNGLSGPIPADINLLTSLTGLDLGGNALTGTIPEALYQLTGLTSLSLCGNDLEGGLTESISGLSSLTYFSVCNNQLDGELPASFYNMVNLEAVFLYGNQFTGNITSGISQLANLYQFNANGNLFSGEIPSAFFDIEALAYLDLCYNQFTGSLPTNVSNAAGLINLSLCGNQLSGSIPPDLGTLPALQWLLLASNNFDGAVPDLPATLQYLHLNNNSLTDLPDLTNLSNLVQGFFSNNYFEFDDIIPNQSVPNANFSPQKTFPGLEEVTITLGDPLVLDYSATLTHTSGNVYQWYRNGTPVEENNSLVYSVSSSTLEDEGNYYLEITNPGFEPLTLQTEQLLVTVDMGEFGGVTEGDYNALVELYNAMGGTGWFNPSGWLDEQVPVSEWYGVTVTGDRVTGLGLSFNNVTGELPEAIGNLAALEILDLNGNPIVDPLPESLGNLTALTYLGLGQNYSHQSITQLPATIGNLTSLVVLNVSANLLEELPAGIGNMTSLEGLIANNNQFTSLPDIFTNMSGLRELNIEGNQLSALPASLSSLAALENVHIGYNPLPTFPSFLYASASTLNVLSIVGTQFGDLPADLNTFTALQSLSIGNGLMTAFPPVVFELTGLTSLYVYSSPIAEIPEGITALENLYALAFGSCGLTGPLPDYVVNLPQLVFLDVSYNSLTSLPDFTGSSITSLYIGGNILPFGELEKVISLPTLDYINQKPLPAIDVLNPAVGDPVSVQISVSGTGNVYQWYKNEAPLDGFNTDLLEIGSADETTSGTYRLQITNSAFPLLVLSSESISVDVVVEVLENDRLALVELYNAMGGTGWFNPSGWLDDQVPVSEWYGVTVTGDRVTQLNLTSNNLTGPIPAAIGNLTALTNLDIGFNPITGTIPEEIGSLVQLVQLSCWDCDLEGAVPESLGNLGNVMDLAFGLNRLSGTLPATLVNLPAGGTATFEHNELTGLPDLTGLSSASFVVRNNLLEFDDLAPNAGIPSIFYSPQKSLVLAGSLEVTLGSSLNLSATVGGTDNIYQWYKNFDPIDGANTSTYFIEAATSADAGTYRLQVTNQSVPSLILQSEEVTVEVLSPSYTGESEYFFLSKIGAEAQEIFQYSPSRIATDSEDNVYATDITAGTITKLSATGGFLFSFNFRDHIPHVNDIETDAVGNFFVSDETSSRVVKYTASGEFDLQIDFTDGAYGIAIDNDNNILFLPRITQPFAVRKHDGITAQFIETIVLTEGPTASIYLDIETDTEGNIYALEPSIGRIDKFTSEGLYISSFEFTEIIAPWSAFLFEVAPGGDIYVVDYSTRSVVRFNSTGDLLSTFGSDVLINPFGIAGTVDGILVGDAGAGLLQFGLAGDFIETVGPQKNATGQFNQVSQMAFDSQGNGYVADAYNGRIQKFDGEGNFISIIASRGIGTDQLLLPASIAIDADDNLYVADAAANRVQKYSTAGVHLQSIGSTGADDGQFVKPIGVAISTGGYLFVLDGDNARVQKFQPDGTHVLSFGTGGTGEGQFTQLAAIAVEADGTLLIANNTPNKFMRFNEEGLFLEEVLSGHGYTFGLSTDSEGAVYLATSSTETTSAVKKLDADFGLISYIGTSGFEDGGVVGGSTSVLASADGESVWTSSYPDRVSIFHRQQTEPTPVIPADLFAYPWHDTGMKVQWMVDPELGGDVVLERSPSDSGPFEPVATVPVGTNIFTDEGLEPNTVYYYRAKHVIEGSESPFSASRYASTFSSGAAGTWEILHDISTPDRITLTGIDTDGDGNIYVSGNFIGTVVIQEQTLVSAGSNDGIILKFGPANELLWAKPFGSEGVDLATRVRYDGANGVVFSGIYNGSFMIDDVSIATPAFQNGLAGKLNAETGEAIWLTGINSPEESNANGIDVDTDGNVYLAGFFNGTFSFGDSELTGGGPALYKIDAAGEPAFARTGVLSGETDYVNNFYAVKVSGENVYVAGEVQGNWTFGSFPVTASALRDAVLIKYDLQGTEAWVQTLGGAGQEYSLGLAVDAAGSVFWTGDFDSETVTLGAETLNNSGAGFDIFLAKVDPAGAVTWARQAGTPNEADFPYSIATDGTNVFLAGTMSYLPTTFGSTTLENGRTFLLSVDAAGDVRWADNAEGPSGTPWSIVYSPVRDGLLMAGSFEYIQKFEQTYLESEGSRNGFVAFHEDGVQDTGNADIAALTQLYNTMGGSTWTNSTNWLSAQPLEMWYGLTVDGSGRVTAINLAANNLTGTLPAGLFEMDALSTLNLAGNGITGTIPKTISGLVSLERLMLNDNQLTGAVPSTITSISSLRSINIANNLLSDLPALGALSLLGVQTGDGLFVGGNDFHFDDLVPNAAIPNFIYSPQRQITALQPYTVTAGQPISLPYTIGGAGNIYQWYKGGEPLQGATSATFTTASAALADAGSYQLRITNSALPLLTLETGTTVVTVNPLAVAAGDRSALVDLYNATGGASWTNKTNWLSEQDASTWHGVTVVNGRVEGINLASNNLTGAIPTSLANLTQLKQLVLNDNQLTGLPNLSALALTTFNVSTNALTFEDLEPNILKLTAYSPQAQIPSGGNRTLTEEEALSLQFTVGGVNNTYQWFKDEVAIQGATAATYAVASARQANSGSYRLEIRNSTVAGLVLTTQAFTVTVNLKTVETTDRAALEALYNGTNGAAWTNKTGWLTDAPVGEWFGVTVELGKVVSVVLPSNNLAGPLPHSLFAMQSLRSLNLSGNQLSGTMPETITGMAQLQQLYLQDNQITGRIPSALGNLTALTALDLGRNRFYGSLPSSIGNLVNLESILGLAGNDLTGTLPASLGSLTKLKILAADDNQFEGLVPAELGSMAALTELYLHKNLLSGAVPAALSSLAGLQRLYLNENALEGTFPAAIAGITALKHVVLNDNKFTSLPSFKNGPVPDRLHIANNKVGFGSIEPNMGIADFIYSPQGKYGLPADILHNVGEDYTFELGMGGTSNTYQWFKNDQAIQGATAKDLVVTNPQSDAEGVYYARVTNTAVPGLELQTEDYNFKLSSLERDRLALIAFFNATGGTNWINKANWGTTASLDTWSGITVANNRVTQINLPNNRIVGDIPNDIRDIGALQVVNFSNSGEAFNPDVDNQIRSMPDMSRLTTLASVNLTRNRLGFSSIEPNYVGLGDKFLFSPQRRFGETTNTQVEVGTRHRLEIQVSGNNNIYQWYFNSGAAGATDVAIAGATQRVYFIDAVNYETQGIYYAKVTSPLVPGFDLRNRNQNIQAITSISGVVADGGTPLASGTVTLYMVRSGPYLNLGTVDLTADGTYTFAGVPLADYLLLATPPQTEGFADALKTYYSSTINWEEADTLVVRAKTEGVGISLLRIPSDLGGDNVAAGVLEVDIPDEEIVDEESRVLARLRVNGAGVSLSRQRARSKGLDEEFDYEFVAYVVTDENGEFRFEGLPDAVYRINVQFPGVPMDQSSDLLLSFDENTDGDAVSLSALVTPTGISVQKVVVKGVAATYLRDLLVYPNPGEDLVQLAYFVKRKVAGLVMNVYDVRGQKMVSRQLPFSRGPQHTELNLTGLAAGMYMLTITDVNNTFMETFRIQKK